MPETTAATAGHTRRTVIKAAAWAAPVVAVAVAAPLAAASTTPATPAPAGRSFWDGGTAVNKYVTTQPQYIRFNQGASIGFTVEDANGDTVADGTHTSGQASVTITWGAGGTVTAPAPYALTETNLNGWVRVGEAPAAGTSGSVTYLYTGGILNGNGNRVPLPIVRLYPVDSAILTATYATVTQESAYVSASGSFTQAP